MSGSERYETLLAVIEGSLSPAAAARRLETTELKVREWVELISLREAARRRHARSARQATRRSALALALAVGTLLGVAVWGSHDAFVRFDRPSAAEGVGIR